MAESISAVARAVAAAPATSRAGRPRRAASASRESAFSRGARFPSRSSDSGCGVSSGSAIARATADWNPPIRYATTVDPRAKSAACCTAADSGGPASTAFLICGGRIRSGGHGSSGRMAELTVCPERPAASTRNAAQEMK